MAENDISQLRRGRTRLIRAALQGCSEIVLFTFKVRGVHAAVPIPDADEAPCPYHSNSLLLLY